MPYIITRKRPEPGYIGGEHMAMIMSVVYRRAVATLEERIAFDAVEWRAAGYDQPDGNFRFWHHALICCTYTAKSGREVADLLWLHNGVVTHGHFVDRLDKPGGPTRADREKFPNWPERWDGPLIPERGGKINLADDTVVEVERVEKRDLREAAGIEPHPGGYRLAFLLDAYNAAQGEGR